MVFSWVLHLSATFLSLTETPARPTRATSALWVAWRGAMESDVFGAGAAWMDMDNGHECGKLNNKPSSKYPQMVGLLLGFPNYTTMLMGQELGT